MKNLSKPAHVYVHARTHTHTLYPVFFSPFPLLHSSYLSPSDKLYVDLLVYCLLPPLRCEPHERHGVPPALRAVSDTQQP